jgi:twitching motility protein PilT
MISYQIPSIEELGLPEIVKKLVMLPRGLVLVTGPTGSGKSTTLAAMVDWINTNRAEHILTIEDPIEYIHTSKQSIINQREIGNHTHSFSNALRAALREDPDVILIGEMRDLETISLAVRAAETGHLVFATLHTSSAAGTIDRLIDVFPAEQQAQVRTQLSHSLKAVLSQSLLARRDGQGRVVAMEAMLVTPGVANLIRESKTSQIYSAIQTGKNIGMQTLESALAELYNRDVISLEDAMSRSSKVDELKNLVGVALKA